MGLDAYAGFQEPTQKRNDNVVELNDNIGARQEQEFYWRKHARLQQYMMELYDKKHDGPARGERQGMMDSFNGGKLLVLDRIDIEELQLLIQDDNLPFCPDGFFWGHQFQEESMKEYKQQDLQFCEKALTWIDEGKTVWYDCSW
jgi:hypothetical protein